jgi:hypothetical protein
MLFATQKKEIPRDILLPRQVVGGRGLCDSGFGDVLQDELLVLAVDDYGFAGLETTLKQGLG